MSPSKVAERLRAGHGAQIEAIRPKRAPGPAPGTAIDHEELVVRRGPRSGGYLIIAVHSTALGPALGGARLRTYPSPSEAIADALRLARTMTFKAAAAGLELGGGKGVIFPQADRPLTPALRRQLLLEFGEVVESLDGRYITAEDIGTAAEDMAVIRARTKHVTGLPVEVGGSGDPSSFTAQGLEAAMRACCAHLLGSPELASRRVAVMGLGHVGSNLARRLAGAGAELLVSDIDPDRRSLARELGARWLDPGDILFAECEILAPCALGGVIDRLNLGRLRCAIVCGSANNQLDDESLAEELEGRGVLYAPDFIVNAGGLINVYGELRGHHRASVQRLVEGIGETMAKVLDSAAERALTPLEAAYGLARERLGAAKLAGAGPDLTHS